MRRTRLLAVVFAMLAAMLSASPSWAQDKPLWLLELEQNGGRVRPPVEEPPPIERGTRNPSEGLMCFWHVTNNGTPFGSSGMCDYRGSLPVGSQCRCNANSSGRPDGSLIGTIMQAPTGGGAPPVVR